MNMDHLETNQEDEQIFEHEDPTQVGSDLDARQIFIRVRFAEEYVKDRDWVAAAIRIGHPGGEPSKKAGQFFKSDPYTQKLIAAKLGNVESDNIEDKKDFIEKSLIREANYTGPGSSHAARVNALNKLMSLYGLEAEKKVAVTKNSKNTNINAEVPEVDWGSMDEEEREMLRTLMKKQLERSGEEQI